MLFAGCSRGPVEGFPEPERLPMVQARVSEDNPRVGDVVEVDIRVTAEERLDLPPLRELFHEEIFVLDAPPGRESRDENRWTRDARLRMALYSVTNVTLFAEASVPLPGDPDEKLELPFVSITVRSMVEGEDAVPNRGNTDLMDFRGSEATRRFYRNIGLSLIGLALLIALIAVAWARSRAKHKPPPPLPRWDLIALEKMQALKSSEVWTSGDADGSAVALSRILREYIERRFRIHAPELTTEEFLVEASERQPWPAEEQTELEAFFGAVDKIKFAGERPGNEVLEELLRAAERFVRASGDNTGGNAP